jgi:hypothetical protein
VPQLILGVTSATRQGPTRGGLLPVALLGLFPRLGHVETVWVFYQLKFAVLLIWSCWLQSATVATIIYNIACSFLVINLLYCVCVSE